MYPLLEFLPNLYGVPWPPKQNNTEEKEEIIIIRTLIFLLICAEENRTCFAENLR